MKIKNLFLPGLLSIAVVVSVVLSSSIWVNPAHYRDSQQTSLNNNSSIDNKPMSYVYSPTQLIKTDENGKQNMLTNHSINLISEVGNQMKNYHNKSIKKLSSGNVSEYKKFLQYNNSIILNYPSKISIKIFSKFINDSLSKGPNRSINRIVVPFNDSNEIYLMSDNGFNIYKAKFKNTNVSGLKNAIKNNVGTIPVKIEMVNKTPTIDFIKSFKMPQYGYLINKTSQNYYVTRLLPNLHNTNNIKRHRNSVVYNDQSSKQLTFYNNGEAEYFDSRPNFISSDFTQTLIDSYKNISKLNISDNLSNLRYFSYSPKNSTIIYRNYVEGFPIFNQNQYGAVQIKLVDNTSLRYNFSLNNLQIPVPTGGSDIKMKTTNEVVNDLSKSGYDTKKIGPIELGYQWSSSKNSNILVTLQPTWFIYYNGRWNNYDQMINKIGY
ncbi:YycH family regulatory protein [Apilactobacillus quenuiae]|uniref:YycH family regulatory protein n=1 Tax=Apilactobacillus quenuiae TaxID=2008377 RepID=UPI0012FFE4AE|nr:two-component system activity regulator YycH [Apilactobacillus quenuiae]